MEASFAEFRNWIMSPIPLPVALFVVIILILIYMFPREGFNPTALARGQQLDSLGQTGQGLGPQPRCGDVLANQDAWEWMSKVAKENMANKGAIPNGTRLKIDDADLVLSAMGQT